MSGTYHYFQCLNHECTEQVVVDVRRETCTPNMELPCPCCREPMKCDGTIPADQNGYKP